MILVELSKLVRRPRTWGSVTLLAGLPTLVAILIAVTDIGPRPGEGPPFLSAVLTNGSLYPAAALALVLPLFLPVAVAVVAGDTVAGEAQAGTLRYLLARPVGRTRLLVAKLVGVAAYVLLAVVVVAGVAYVTGTTLFGTETLAGGAPGLSGNEFTTVQATWRTGLAVLYVAWSMMGVAAFAVFISTLTDSPLAAALGALTILISSTILLGLDASAAFQPYLPTRYWLAFVDLFRDPVLTRELYRGVALQAVYVVVLLGAAWANFTSKDVTS